MASNLSFDILAVDKASRVFDKVGHSASGLGSKVGRAGAFMGKAMAGAAVGGVAVLGAAFVGAVKDAASLQKTIAQTNAVIKSTGGAAGVSAEHIRKLSNSINDYSNIDDEVIQQGANMLLTFKNLRNEAGKGNDVFDQSTKVLADMTTALGSDPQKQAIQLGKALNDPVAGISALSRVGVTFTAGQKKTIKSLVDSGHAMDAQKIILAELNSEFGGSAKAAGQTFSGAMFRLKDAFGDALRDGIMPLLPALTRLADWLGAKLPLAIAAVSRLFHSGAGSAGGFSASVRGLVNWVRGSLAPALMSVAVNVLPKLKQLFTTVTTAVRDNRATFQALGKFITGVLIPVIRILYSSFLTSLIVQIRVVSWVLSHVVSAVSAVVRAFNGLKKAVSGSKLGAVLAAPFKIALATINAAIGAARTLQNLIDPGNGWISGSFTPVSHGPSPTRHRASGGPVTRNTPYLVGEQGPELFVPGASGGIVPNGKSSGRGAAASGGTTNNFYISGALDPNAVGDQIVAILQKKVNRTGALQLKIKT